MYPLNSRSGPPGGRGLVHSLGAPWYWCIPLSPLDVVPT